MNTSEKSDGTEGGNLDNHHEDNNVSNHNDNDIITMVNTVTGIKLWYDDDYQ